MEESRRKSIKEWEIEERPREKMLLKGEKALTDAELLAILIGTGTRDKSAIDLAKELLTQANNDLNHLARTGMKAMMKIKGIGPAKAITLAAALELGRRKLINTALEQKFIKNSQEAANLLAPLLSDLPHEAFYVIYLSTNGKIIHHEQISSGGLAATIVEPRLIIRKALNWYAASLIVAHNHPSGNLTPSHADKKITSKLKQAADLFDIRLNDHLIITNNGYLSFADEGFL